MGGLVSHAGGRHATDKDSRRAGRNDHIRRPDAGGHIPYPGRWQTADKHGRAAGRQEGPPTCGIGGTAGVTMGQVCMSATRAAGFPMLLRNRIQNSGVRIQNATGICLQ